MSRAILVLVAMTIAGCMGGESVPFGAGGGYTATSTSDTTTTSTSTSEPPPMVCAPDAQVACACPTGLPSVQVCNADGSALGPCSCGSSSSSSASSSSSSSASSSGAPPPPSCTRSSDCTAWGKTACPSDATGVCATASACSGGICQKPGACGCSGPLNKPQPCPPDLADICQEVPPYTYATECGWTTLPAGCSVAYNPTPLGTICCP